MKTLIQTCLFSMFISYMEGKSLVPENLSPAYDEFADTLFAKSTEVNKIILLRMLTYTKIELSCVQQLCISIKERKHILYDIFISKVLHLLEMEIDMTKNLFLNEQVLACNLGMEMVTGQKGKNGITLAWNGTDNDLIEMVAALMAAGVIGSAEGKKVTIVEVFGFFEQIFNLKIKALYTKRGKVFDRCTDATPFLDRLKKSYEQMLEKRLM